MIQRMKRLPAFFLPDILYRLCRNRNFKDKNQISRSGTNTWFLFRSTPSVVKNFTSSVPNQTSISFLVKIELQMWKNL